MKVIYAACDIGKSKKNFADAVLLRAHLGNVEDCALRCAKLLHTLSIIHCQ